MYVVAMNRLRGAYVDLDPVIEQYFLASVYDDQAGMKRTYSFLRTRSVSILLGSSSVLLFVVNACVFGLFAGAIVVSAGGAVGWAITAGVLVGLGLFAGLFWYLGRRFRGAWRRYEPRDRPRPGRRRTGGRRTAQAIGIGRERQPLRAEASHHPAVQPLVGDVASVGAREEDVVECAGDALDRHRVAQPERCAGDVVDDEHGVGARQLFRPARRHGRLLRQQHAHRRVDVQACGDARVAGQDRMQPPAVHGHRLLGPPSGLTSRGLSRTSRCARV